MITHEKTLAAQIFFHQVDSVVEFSNVRISHKNQEYVPCMYSDGATQTVKVNKWNECMCTDTYYEESFFFFSFYQQCKITILGLDWIRPLKPY